MRVSLLLVVLVSLALLVSGSTPGDRRLGTTKKLTASEAAALGRNKLSGSSTTTAATTSSAKPAAASSSTSKPVATQSASTSNSAASTSTSKKATTDASTTTSSTPAVASVARVATSTTSNLKTCASQCLNGGYCFDGTCQCPFGYGGLYCQTKQSCPIDPTSSLQCGGVSRGTCDPTTLKCVCAPGFTGDQCQNADKLCGGTNCNNHGSCVKGLCFCDAGFTGTSCERQTSCGTDATNPCGGRGLCYDNKCQCYPGFTGEFCQTPLRDFQSCKNNCTGRGVCEFGQCLCPPQFSGDDCSQHQAGSFCAVAGGDCSGHGICSDNKCVCEPGTSGTFCEKGGCKKCHPRHGVCLGDKCFCQPGYGGDDCSTALTCSNNCNNHGTCVAGKCQCEKYFSGDACEKSEFPAGVCPNKCSGNGVCYQGKCLCITGRSGSDCSTVIPTTCGSAPPTVVALTDSTSALVPAPVTGPDCNGNGNCFRKLCVCKPGYYGDYCEKKRVCSAECSKNGICNYGTCLCAPDFTGVDCQISTHRQQELLSISGTALDQYREKDFTCVDGDKQKCSLHGTCKSNKCVCDEGFSGLICESILITGVYSSRCPASCSNHGFCQLGKCVCDLGYTGDACDKKLDIPCTNNCNGKGICEFGRCHCDADYAGLACETKLKCSVDCASKSQGVCVAGRCVCLNGYTGIDCSYAPATSTSKKALLFATTSKKARFASVGHDAEGEADSSELDSLVDHPVHTELSAATAAPGLGQYIVPMPPVVMGILAFVLGVLVAFIINYAWAKREEHVRKQKMLKPLLSSR